MYSTEKSKLVDVFPLVGDAVPVHRIVGGPPVEQTTAADVGRAEPTTISETARSSAVMVATVARITLVEESPVR